MNETGEGPSGPKSRPGAADKTVRLISRQQANEAIKTGSVVTRAQRTEQKSDPATVAMPKLPLIIGDEEDPVIDLRSGTQASPRANASDDFDPERPAQPKGEPSLSKSKPADEGNQGSTPSDEPVGATTDNSFEEPASEDTIDLTKASMNAGAGESSPAANEPVVPPWETPPTAESGKSSTAGSAGAGETTAGSDNTGSSGKQSIFDRIRNARGASSVGALPRFKFKPSAPLAKRLATAAAFAVAAAIAFSAGPGWACAMACAVLVLAGMEYFDGLRRVGFRPATLLALLAIAGLTLGAYARGEPALPLIVAVTVAFTFLWYMTGIIRQAPTANIAVTILGVVWIGVMGSYAALLLRMPQSEGVAFLLGAILMTIAYDSGAFFTGSAIGKRKMLPEISPSKSWEGAVGGTICAVIVGFVVGSLVAPWSVAGAIGMALAVSVVAPIGDFAESMVKRDLGIKDMGRLLPGHGGVFDRFDAMLLVLPTTYYLVHVVYA